MSEQLSALLAELCALPREIEWVEFKQDYQPGDWGTYIGEYLSALSNSAALHRKEAAYFVWGVEDGTHHVVGTSFRPRETKVGNEELENWLHHSLTPQIDFQIHEFDHGGNRVVLFEIQPARSTPVRLRDVEFIRVGSYKKKLKDHPEKERALWATFAETTFEKGIAAAGVSSDDVLALIDYPAYFELTGGQLPDNRAGILDRMIREKIVVRRGNDRFDVTNLGAVLFAKRLNDFERLARKALRVVIYKGKNRTETTREQEGTKGYAVGFEGAIQFINDQLPQNEHIEQALRREVRMYPEIAVRELVANALIHQDFTMLGTGPMVEIFSGRVEITNPGIPLIDTLRFIGNPPQSRNEALASIMRRVHICEERGSGIAKVVLSCEQSRLPAPEFSVEGNHTKAVLFAHQELTDMDRNDRIRACYQHACLCVVSGERMTNATLRKRFGIEEKNAARASRIIVETIEAGLIKPHDPNAGRRYMKYIPFWG